MSSLPLHLTHHSRYTQYPQFTYQGTDFTLIRVGSTPKECKLPRNKHTIRAGYKITFTAALVRMSSSILSGVFDDQAYILGYENSITATIEENLNGTPNFFDTADRNRYVFPTHPSTGRQAKSINDNEK